MNEFIKQSCATSANAQRILAVGMFDGVHLGHRALLVRMSELAKAHSLVPLAYTFSNHPRSVLGNPTAILMPPEEKRRAIEALGIAVETTQFTCELSRLAPEQFVALLQERYGMRAWIMSENFRFGHGGAGTPELLTRLGAQRGFTVEIVKQMLLESEPVSSTRIREALTGGDVELACKMLGRPYALSGPVERGEGIGRSLGFPTANVTPPNGRLLPRHGVYITRAVIDGAAFMAVTNIGIKPTVSHSGKVFVEAHVLDNAEDLYGADVTLEFFARLRDEVRFESTRALAEQIHRDACKTREYFGAQGLHPVKDLL